MIPGTTPPSMTLSVLYLGLLRWLLTWFSKPQKPPVLDTLAPGQAQDGEVGKVGKDGLQGLVSEGHTGG